MSSGINSASPVIAIMGPTASGKTGLALDIAKQVDSEIISVDSALVYRDMDIGTAKPDEQTLKDFPHHLIDIIDPAEVYSAGQFREDALRLMQRNLEFHARGVSTVVSQGERWLELTMDFAFEDAYHKSLPEAYERLLMDVLRGDSTLFTRSDELEAAWRFVQPVLDQLAADARRENVELCFDRIEHVPIMRCCKQECRSR